MAKLRVRLNNIIRAITFSKSFSSMTALYKNLNILKLEDIYKLELAKFMYQINYKKVPKIFVDLFTSTTKLHHYETRRTRSSNFFLPRVNKTIAQNQLAFKGSVLWQSINSELKELHWHSFKKSYKKLLIDLY